MTHTALLLLLAALAADAGAQAQLRHDGGVAYIEGASGADAKRIAPDMNLALVFEDARARVGAASRRVPLARPPPGLR